MQINPAGPGTTAVSKPAPLASAVPSKSTAEAQTDKVLLSNAARAAADRDGDGDAQ